MIDRKQYIKQWTREQLEDQYTHLWDRESRFIARMNKAVEENKYLHMKLELLKGPTK